MEVLPYIKIYFFYNTYSNENMSLPAKLKLNKNNPQKAVLTISKCLKGPFANIVILPFYFIAYLLQPKK
jgi:hypothetical protein